MNVKINIKKLFGMTIRIKNLEQENGSLRKEAKLMQERIESYAQEVEHLKQRNHTWQKDFAASNSRCKALDEQCEALKLEIQVLKTEEDKPETTLDLYGFGKDPEKFSGHS